jgi:hypothetical protein
MPDVALTRRELAPASNFGRRPGRAAHPVEVAWSLVAVTFPFLHPRGQNVAIMGGNNQGTNFGPVPAPARP